MTTQSAATTHMEVALQASWLLMIIIALAQIQFVFNVSALQVSIEGIGAALTPNSSAIVAVIEHRRVAQREEALIAEGAHILRSAIATDIAAQLQAGGNVLYTMVEDSGTIEAARVAETQEGTRVSEFVAGDDGVFIGHAEFTDEQPVED